jgi:hypothetical protein
MARRIRKVDYFAMKAPNKRGEAARVLNMLSKAGVNLLAFTGFPEGKRAQMDFIPERTSVFRSVARRAKLKLRPKKSGFLVQGDDGPGAMAKVMSKLADAKINVTAVDAVCAGKRRFGAILWVRQKQVSKAKRVLNAS